MTGEITLRPGDSRLAAYREKVLAAQRYVDSKRIVIPRDN